MRAPCGVYLPAKSFGGSILVNKLYEIGFNDDGEPNEKLLLHIAERFSRDMAQPLSEMLEYEERGHATIEVKLRVYVLTYEEVIRLLQEAYDNGIRDGTGFTRGWP